MNVSIFKKFNEVVENRPIIDIVADIRNGVFKTDVEKIRQLAANGKKDEADNLKKRLLGFTPSGLFEGGRKPEFLKEYTRFIILDIDKLQPQQVDELFNLAIDLNYTFACFRSPSGNGLKIIVKVDSEKEAHTTAYNQVAAYYEEQLSINIDRSGKDYTRLCFMSFDSQAFTNIEREVFHVSESPVIEFPQVAIQETPDYDKLFEKCVEFTNQKENYLSGNRNNFIHLLAHNCNREGIPDDTALKLIRSNFDLSEPEIIATVQSAYGDIAEHNTKKKKGKLPLIDKIEQFLERNYYFRYNEVTGRLEFKVMGEREFEPVSDYLENSVLRNLLKNSIKCNQTTLRSILNSNFCMVYNPFNDYFNSLPKWDEETDYITELANTVTTSQQELWQVCFKKWLVALVATALNPKIINHTVIVLTGGQGVGKTTWSLKLLPKCLEKYMYSGSINPNNKDTLIHLTECILINLDELENLSRTEIGSLKEMITKSQIRMRRAYGHNNETLERRASFIGSVNTAQFLNDSTGSRRFLCFEVTGIQYNFDIPLEKVYAQAIYLMKSDFQFWFDKSEIEAITTNNEQYQIRTIEEELLLTWFRKPNPDERPQYYATAQILSKLASYSHVNATTGNAITLGKALRKHGYERVKKGGAWVYPVIELTHDQVETESKQAPESQTDDGHKAKEQAVEQQEELPF